MECIIRLFTLFLLKKYSCFHKNRLCFHQNQQELDTDINIHVWVLSEILGTAMNSVVSATMEIDTAAAMEITVNSVSIAAIDAGLGAHLEHPSTPQPTSSPSITVSCKGQLTSSVSVC
jgi:hypothetical protein